MSLFYKILIILCVNSVVFSEIYIDVTQGINNPCQIGIVPFHNNKSNILNIENVSNIIIADLQNTGKFNILSYLQLPEKPNKTSEITPEKWLHLGITTLLIGTIIPINNNQYIIFYQLIDILSGHVKVILKNQYTVTYQWIRYIAHVISNDIFEELTGIKGAFCTRIAYIVYVNNTKYPYKLYISDYDGYNEILIYHSEKPLMSPTWAPSGKQLVYVVFVKNQSILVVHDLILGSIHQLINFPQHNGAPSISPDGKKLAFASSQTGSLNLYVMDLTIKKIQQVTNERSNNTEPSWFPDNKTLAYTSDRSGKPQIYTINIDNINNTPKRLSWLESKNQNGTLSSDGTFLIMVNSNNNNQNITKLNLLTGEYKKLTNTLLDETPTLSPNNSMIIYSTVKELGSKLYLLSSDGHHITQLPINHKCIRFPAWSSYVNE